MESGAKAAGDRCGETDYDVAIIGGGPGGSTCASLLRKYAPQLRVAVVEREVFPREHVGESQLPLTGAILNEMGCWEKVERANFPIKLGATYRWGSSPDLWDFEFIPFGQFRDEPRPVAKFGGQRMFTAFQVERGEYDKILLDHAAELGAEVLQPARVREVLRSDGGTGDRVDGLALEDGSTITARHYVDASGHVGILRRAMGVECEYPGNIKNVAFWDYWDNAEWAVSIGTGGTRVFVLSIGCGWIWFIPIRPNRVSIGFICPADYYKSCGKTPEELYAWAVEQDPLVVHHTRNATREGETRSTKDWSFLSKRMVGENWFLVGEAAGFADPILAGGLMLTHAGARELAYVIAALEAGEHDPVWLRHKYEALQARRIGQHIRFADFWYAGNGCFTDLEEMTSRIAKDAGISLSPKQAFQWLANGGFMEDIPGRAGIGGMDVAGAKEVAGMFLGAEDAQAEVGWRVNEFNLFRASLEGSVREEFPVFRAGKIHRVPCLRRGAYTMPLMGAYAMWLRIMETQSDINQMCREVLRLFMEKKGATQAHANFELQQAIQALEVMLIEGWVVGEHDPKRPRLGIRSKKGDNMIHANRDVKMEESA